MSEGPAVWEDGEGVKLALGNPVVTFSNLFFDSVGTICTDPTSIPCQIFSIFPMVVRNELAAVLNGALSEFGTTEALELYTIPAVTMPSSP